MSNKSGRLDATIQRTWPRSVVSAITSMSLLKTRLLTPESPLSPRLTLWSTSSINTMQGRQATIASRARSKRLSVSPTHLLKILERFSSTNVTPDSLASALARRVLPVPAGPISRMPWGTRRSSPARIVATTVSRRSRLTSSSPPRLSNPKSTSEMCSTSANSEDMISSLRCLISAWSTGCAWKLARNRTSSRSI